jgi:hypothetical protein
MHSRLALVIKTSAANSGYHIQLAWRTHSLVRGVLSVTASWGLRLETGANLFNRLPAHHSALGRKHRIEIPKHHTTSTMALFLTPSNDDMPT